LLGLFKASFTAMKTTRILTLILIFIPTVCWVSCVEEEEPKPKKPTQEINIADHFTVKGTTSLSPKVPKDTIRYELSCSCSGIQEGETFSKSSDVIIGLRWIRSYGYWPGVGNSIVGLPYKSPVVTSVSWSNEVFVASCPGDPPCAEDEELTLELDIEDGHLVVDYEGTNSDGTSFDCHCEGDVQ